jgi:hypothetical protein
MVLQYINPGLAKRVILPRRGFIQGLLALIAIGSHRGGAPTDHPSYASVRRPPLVWHPDPYGGEMVALNGAEVQVAEFPDLFSAFGYLHGGARPTFYLSDGFSVDEKPYQKEFEWFVSPRVGAAGMGKVMIPVGYRVPPHNGIFNGGAFFPDECKVRSRRG